MDPKVAFYTWWDQASEAHRLAVLKDQRCELSKFRDNILLLIIRSTSSEIAADLGSRHIESMMGYYQETEAPKQTHKSEILYLYSGRGLRIRAALYLDNVPEGTDEQIRIALYEHMKESDLGEALCFKFGKRMEDFTRTEMEETVNEFIEIKGLPVRNPRIFGWCFELGIDPITGAKVDD